MTAKELRNLCRYYQKLLRLNDVDITIRFAINREMDDWGSTECTADNTRALIKICPMNLASLDSLQIIDEEITLVHELLHIQERSWSCAKQFKDLKQDNRTVYAAHEAGIERNAQAIVALRRQLDKG